MAVKTIASLLRINTYSNGPHRSDGSDIESDIMILLCATECNNFMTVVMEGFKPEKLP